MEGVYPCRDRSIFNLAQVRPSNSSRIRKLGLRQAALVA